MSAYTTHLTKRENNHYIESKRWACVLSPTGSHYWMVKGTIREGEIQVCKYCREKRRMNNGFKFNPQTEDRIINDGKTNPEL